MHVQLEGKKTARGLSSKAVMITLVGWWHFRLAAILQCPLLSSRRQYLSALFPSWQLGPLLPVSSFHCRFDRLIYTYMFCFVLFVKPHASFFLGSGQISGERCWQCWQTWEGCARESVELPASLRFPHLWLSQRCSWEPAWSCCSGVLFCFLCLLNPSPASPRVCRWNKTWRKDQNHLFF